MITSIATLGLSSSQQFVEEYSLLYSDSGGSWRPVLMSDGTPKLFKGNRNGDVIQRNYFQDNPIIARWIRINPTRWRDRISMRVEIYGCNYVEEVMSFDGLSYVRRDLSYQPVMSHRDLIRLRFQTNVPDGILLYSRGTQGDYIALQLFQNKLILNMDLGAKQITTVTVGSLLDDNLWHDVSIFRENKDIVFTVDRVIARQKMRGDFEQLDLNQEMFVGGVPNFNMEGLIVTYNFSGCVENLFINYTNLVYELKYKQDYTYTKVGNGIGFVCREVTDSPVTFRTAESYGILKSNEGMPNLNISINFRTFNEEGLLLYHKFHSNYGSIKMYLNNGKIKIDLAVGDIPRITIDNFQEMFNDGVWHKAVLMATTSYMELNVDKKPVKISRALNFLTGNTMLIGGGVYGSIGFIGCMRFDGHMVQPASFEGDVLRDSCQLVDRCNPNPCEHGGVCRQNSEEFFCDCGNNGYGGAVCHTSLKHLSCESFRQNNPNIRQERIMIDIDGSGPLPAFKVLCDVNTENLMTTTRIGHRSEKPTIVNGFDRPGSFMQEIYYDANIEQLTQLVNRSRSCKQSLAYECFRSRLLNTPVRDPRRFEPFSWWVSRQNQRMDFWSGSLPGTFKCKCGMDGTCVDPTKWCNCDSYRETLLVDDGEITTKEFLPVRQLRFGDTGGPLDNKKGTFSLGPLICEGDYMYDNVVTFKHSDATINYPTFDMGHSGDIYFEFRTTQENGVLIHSIGPTDYIKITIVGGDQIQFTYYSGNGPLGVSAETLIKLNDNRWHSVLIERNRKEASVVVDGSIKNTVREPIGASRAIYLTSEFVVGATVDYRDGFVGCMRALMLNGRPIEMNELAKRGLYGVLPGCVGKCESSPCLNNATCWEGYSHYTCDCRWTAFKGPICADEIGVHMRKDDMVEYKFEGTYKSTTEEKIRIGFFTSEPGGMLMGLYGKSGEYMSIMLANSGDLKVVFDFGFERQEVIYENRLANAQTHDVKIYRKHGGRTLVIQADNYEPMETTFKLDKTQDVQFDNIINLYLGRNHSMNTGEGFTGCISRVQFDDVYVLKLLFQEDRPQNIRSIPSDLKEDFCGIEPVTYPPEVKESRPAPAFDPSILIEKGGYTRADSAVLGGILAIIFLALIAMAILIGRYVSRHKGEYKTHEDMGARDAPDADTAVAQGQTGHNVSKKKEVFL
ncbi:hypothetical protein CHUAL_010426 [Chamberlinius hualienensis]